MNSHVLHQLMMLKVASTPCPIKEVTCIDIFTHLQVVWSHSLAMLSVRCKTNGELKKGETDYARSTALQPRCRRTDAAAAAALRLSVMSALWKIRRRSYLRFRARTPQNGDREREKRKLGSWNEVIRAVC